VQKLEPISQQERSLSNCVTRRLIWVFIVAVLLNYVWELAQMPLYTGMQEYNAGVFWHCFVAALGDGIMVLLIAAIGRIVLGQSEWFHRPGIRGYLVMITVGLILAVVVEWIALHILNRWQYTEDMPELPVLNVGFIPLLQMMVLPPLIFA
jgi:hypothetical protein